MADVNSHIAYGAGARKAWIKTANGSEWGLEAVVEATGSASQDDLDVNGDDELKARFSSNLREELTVNVNAINLDALSAITGNTFDTTVATDLKLLVGQEMQLNPPYVELTAQTAGKTKEGKTCTIQKTWYKVQLNQVNITQSNGSELSVEMTGTAYVTDTRIDGTTTVSPKAIGDIRIITQANPAVAATGTLTFGGNVSASDTVTVGSVTYTYTNSVSAANDVLLGASKSASMNNLAAAINGGDGEGEDYGSGTVANAAATASVSGSTVTITAKVAGSAGNSIALGESSDEITASGETLSGGTD